MVPQNWASKNKKESFRKIRFREKGDLSKKGNSKNKSEKVREVDKRKGKNMNFEKIKNKKTVYKNKALRKGEKIDFEEWKTFLVKNFLKKGDENNSE